MAGAVVASTFAFVLVGTIVGVRLLLLSRRTGGWPERLIGWGLVGATGMSFPMSIAIQTGAVDGPLAVWVQAIALLMFSSASTAIAGFTRIVFRPDGAGPFLFWTLTIAWVAFMLAGWLELFRTAEPLAGTGPRILARNGLMGLTYLWTAFEAFRYLGQLQRRARLGLGDPQVANSVFYWCVSSVGALLANASMTAVAAFGMDPIAHPFSRIFISLGGSIAAIALWMAFSPARRSSHAAMEGGS